MAGDWIKFEHATIDKPEVLKMAETLALHPDEVVGKLLRVWTWFDKQSTNGDAGGVTNVTLMKFIDRHVDRPGFAACMKLVGWLTDEGIPNFSRHNGESSKNRALTNKRMKKMRDATVTQTPSPEKRREELTPSLRSGVTRANGNSKLPPGWWESDKGIENAAKTLGVHPQKGESYRDLRARVNAALEAH